MLILGFGHRKRVGKDTITDMINTQLRIAKPGLRVKKVSFAAKLKDVSYQLFGWAGVQRALFYENPANAHLRETKLPAIDLTPREVWIKLGNAVRSVYAGVWVEHALKGTEADVILIPDVRFPNEVDAIRGLGGRVYKVTRSSVAVSTDESDCALADFDDWDAVLPNDGDMMDLYNHADKLVKEVLDGPLRT